MGLVNCQRTLTAVAALVLGACARDSEPLTGAPPLDIAMPEGFAPAEDLAPRPDLAPLVDFAWVPPRDGCTAPPPLDLGGYGIGTWYGDYSEAKLAGRTFWYKINVSTEWGTPYYSIQVEGDDAFWVTGCRNDEGGYVFGGDIIGCGCDFRLEVTAEPNKYLLNGKPFEIPALHGAPCFYEVGPLGIEGISCG